MIPRLLLAIVIAVSFAVGPARAQTECASRPSLRYDHPINQGFSVKELTDLTQWLMDPPQRVLSLIISRDGAVIHEIYPAGVDRDDAHYLMSVTKTVTSALVGVALDRKKIPSAETPITELLPDKLFNGGEKASFARVTLREILGMSALDALVPPHQTTPEARQRQTSFLNAANRVNFALQQKLLSRPGEDFQYQDITPYLAGGVVQYATGQSLYDLANDALFKPMDFKNAEWMHQDPSGFDNPAYGLRLRPIDMQKFGLVYLNDGCWEGKRLLSADWVRRSFTPWIGSAKTAERPNYGWYWWTRWRAGGWREHRASGWKGQRISVFPEKRIVVTMTGILENPEGASSGPSLEAQVYDAVVAKIIAAVAKGPESADRDALDKQLQEAKARFAISKHPLSGRTETRMKPETRPKEKHVPFAP